MTTAVQLRAIIKNCAENAGKKYPDDEKGRLDCFIAQMAGALRQRNEDKLSKIVWSLFDQPAPLFRPTAATPA